MFENMGYKPIVNPEWTRYTFSGKIDDDASAGTTGKTTDVIKNKFVVRIETNFLIEGIGFPFNLFSFSTNVYKEVLVR